MIIENLVGKVGIFTSYEDTAWGEYAGKKCTVLEATIEYNNDVDGELTVEFEDGQKLAMGLNEFELI